jgi:hypothetical protein
VHAPGSVSVVVLAHVACEHVVLSGYFWQPPEPSHLPSVPQVETAWVAQ